MRWRLSSRHLALFVSVYRKYEGNQRPISVHNPSILPTSPSWLSMPSSPSLLGSTQSSSELEELFTRCAYAQGRVKRLSPSICVCVTKTRLFAVLPLENRHEIALYRSASQFIFFERCLESRTSLLLSAMAMGF